MAASAAVGGLNVTFYDGSKERHAKTTEYLDNLLAKYGKTSPGSSGAPAPAFPYHGPTSPPGTAAAYAYQHMATAAAAAYLPQMTPAFGGYLPQQPAPFQGMAAVPGPFPAQPAAHQQLQPQYQYPQVPQPGPSLSVFGAVSQQQMGAVAMTPQSSASPYGAAPPLPPQQQQQQQGGLGFVQAGDGAAFHPGIPNPAGGFDHDRDGNFRMVERLRELDKLRANIMQGVRPYSDGAAFEDESLGSSFVPSQVTIPTVLTPPHLPPAGALAPEKEEVVDAEAAQEPPPQLAASRAPQRPRSRVRGGGGAAGSAFTSAVNSAAASPLPSRPQSAKGAGPVNVFAGPTLNTEGVPLPASLAGKARPGRRGGSRATSRATSAAASPLPSRPMSPAASDIRARRSEGPSPGGGSSISAATTPPPPLGDGGLQQGPSEPPPLDLAAGTDDGTLHTLPEGDEDASFDDVAVNDTAGGEEEDDDAMPLMGTMASDQPLMGTVNLAEASSRAASNEDLPPGSHSRTPSDLAEPPGNAPEPLMATVGLSDAPLMGTVTLSEALQAGNDSGDDVPLMGTVTMDEGMPSITDGGEPETALLPEVEAVIREMDQACAREEEEEGGAAARGILGSSGASSARFRSLQVLVPDEDGNVSGADDLEQTPPDVEGVESRLSSLLLLDPEGGEEEGEAEGTALRPPWEAGYGTALETLPEVSREDSLYAAQAAEAAARAAELEAQEEEAYLEWEASEKAKYMETYRRLVQSRSNPPASPQTRESIVQDAMEEETMIEPGYPEPNGRWASRPPRKKTVYTPDLYLGMHGRASAGGSSRGGGGSRTAKPKRLDSAPVKRATSASMRPRLPPRPHSGLPSSSPQGAPGERRRSARSTARDAREVVRDLFKDDRVPLFGVSLSRAPRAAPPRRPISAMDPRRIAANKAQIGAREMKKLDRLSRAEAASRSSRRCSSASSNPSTKDRRRQNFDLSTEPSRELSGPLGAMTLDEALQEMETRVGSTITLLEERQQPRCGDNIRFGKAFSQFIGADNLHEVIRGPGLPPKPRSVQTIAAKAAKAPNKPSGATTAEPEPQIEIPTATTEGKRASQLQFRNDPSFGSLKPEISAPPPVQKDKRVKPWSARPARAANEEAKAQAKLGKGDSQRALSHLRPRSAASPRRKKAMTPEAEQYERAVRKLARDRQKLYDEKRGVKPSRRSPEREKRRLAEEERMQADMKELEELRQAMLQEAAREDGNPLLPDEHQQQADADDKTAQEVAAEGSRGLSRRPSVPTSRIMEKIAKRWELECDRGRYDVVGNWNVELEPSTLKAVRKVADDPDFLDMMSPRSNVSHGSAGSNKRASGIRHTWWGGIQEDSVVRTPPSRPQDPLRRQHSPASKQMPAPSHDAADNDEQPAPEQSVGEAEKPKFSRAHKIKAPGAAKSASAKSASTSKAASSRLRPGGGMQPKTCWRE